MESWEPCTAGIGFAQSMVAGNFRDGKVFLAASIVKVLNDLSLAEGLVLILLCGLGFQAIVLREAGLRVSGSDRQHRRGRPRWRADARIAGPRHDFFVSRWDELPARTPLLLDAVFCDALSWLHSHDELLAAFRGVRGVLRPGGALIFQGEPARRHAGELHRETGEMVGLPRRALALNWRHQEGPVTCPR